MNTIVLTGRMLDDPARADTGKGIKATFQLDRCDEIEKETHPKSELQRQSKNYQKFIEPVSDVQCK